MGPHGVFYKDEPIRELDKALQARGYQLIWPQNSADLLKVIEHNPRICGVIFDWDEYDLELCSDINQLNEYLPLYAFINTHSTMDVSAHDMRMALWFFEYSLGVAEDIATRIQQYTGGVCILRLPASESSIYFCFSPGFFSGFRRENPSDPAACKPLFRVSGGAL
jgi:lysine decarboxylase